MLNMGQHLKSQNYVDSTLQKWRKPKRRWGVTGDPIFVVPSNFHNFKIFNLATVANFSHIKHLVAPFPHWPNSTPWYSVVTLHLQCNKQGRWWRKRPHSVHVWHKAEQGPKQPEEPIGGVPLRGGEGGARHHRGVATLRQDRGQLLPSWWEILAHR